ncbi:hypothetical protein [Xanthomonas arboricola]|uniref:hypothetical protein n=1 Tax=Xanthomonas arboricola TaxID=56448 RepID=UPI0011AFDE46|nr:hypothetical protein [Xanthomonas arboricola]
MVGVQGCKQDMACVVRMTVRLTNVPSQAKQQAGFQQGNRRIFWCGKGAAPSISELCLLHCLRSENGRAKGALRRLLR